MAKKKYTKLGVVLQGEYGPYVVLGSGDKGKEEYRYNVEVRVTDSKGDVKAYGKNKLLTLSDPRKRRGADESKVANIPEKLLFELLLVEEA